MDGWFCKLIILKALSRLEHDGNLAFPAISVFPLLA